jgi:hypothetical protein
MRKVSTPSAAWLSGHRIRFRTRRPGFESRQENYSNAT